MRKLTTELEVETRPGHKVDVFPSTAPHRWLLLCPHGTQHAAGHDVGVPCKILTLLLQHSYSPCHHKRPILPQSCQCCMLAALHAACTY